MSSQATQPVGAMSTEFSSVRESVLKTCRILADQGFLAGTGGNVAVRADEDHFCVTPSGTDYYTMEPADICVVRLSNQDLVTGERKPSVECGLHALVLKARPDCTASIHTHQPVASAYTLLGKPLKVLCDSHRSLLGDVVPCAGYAPSGTSWLAGKVARRVRPDCHAYLMRNHGVVCVGETLEAAMDRVVALEQAAAEFFERQLNARESTLPGETATAVRQALTLTQETGNLAEC